MKEDPIPPIRDNEPIHRANEEYRLWVVQNNMND